MLRPHAVLPAVKVHCMFGLLLADFDDPALFRRYSVEQLWITVAGGIGNLWIGWTRLFIFPQFFELTAHYKTPIQKGR